MIEKGKGGGKTKTGLKFEKTRESFPFLKTKPARL